MLELAVAAVKENSSRTDSRVITASNTYYAFGAASDTGYREYPGLEGHAVVLIPLGSATEHRGEARSLLPQRASTRTEASKQDVTEFATFAVGREWYAVRASHVIEAIDGSGVQPLPARAHWCAGFVMFQGTPIVVADMTRVLGTPPLDTPRIVVVLKTPGRRDPFGLLVETLGDISEVSATRLLPLAETQNGSAPSTHSQLVEHVIQPTDPKDVLVLALNAEGLSNLVGGESKASGAQAREAAADWPATAPHTSEKPAASASSRY